MFNGAYRHNGDHELLVSLGLRTHSFGRDWTALGTVRPRADTAIDVEVCGLPAQFWRFTITRPREEDDGASGREVLVMTTGSGSFGEYWLVARLIADNMVTIQSVAPSPA